MVKSNDPIIVENCHEPIIDNDTFLRASEIMKKRNKQQTVRIGKNITNRNILLCKLWRCDGLSKENIRMAGESTRLIL